MTKKTKSKTFDFEVRWVWLNAELERIAQLQANSKAAIVRQLLVEALPVKRTVAS